VTPEALTTAENRVRDSPPGRFGGILRLLAPGSSWPRAVGAAALTVLAACGVIVLAVPSHARSLTSLESRSNWVLAGALPASNDFPADWGYHISGPLQRTGAFHANTTSTPQPGVPRAVYSPIACTRIPKILNHSASNFGPSMSVDRYTRLSAATAAFVDSDATGELDEQGPRAQLAIWIGSGGPALIADYVDWLGRCDSYHVTNYDGTGTFKSERNVHTVVEGRPPDGADAAVTVIRTFAPVSGHKPSATYYVTYYAVRDVILECTIYQMDGPDRSLVHRRAVETLQRLRAL
jgi:hypothetical protein